MLNDYYNGLRDGQNIAWKKDEWNPEYMQGYEEGIKQHRKNYSAPAAGDLPFLFWIMLAAVFLGPVFSIVGIVKCSRRRNAARTFLVNGEFRNAYELFDQAKSQAVRTIIAGAAVLIMGIIFTVELIDEMHGDPVSYLCVIPGSVFLFTGIILYKKTENEMKTLENATK